MRSCLPSCQKNGSVTPPCPHHGHHPGLPLALRLCPPPTTTTSPPCFFTPHCFAFCPLTLSISLLFSPWSVRLFYPCFGYFTPASPIIYFWCASFARLPDVYLNFYHIWIAWIHCITFLSIQRFFSLPDFTLSYYFSIYWVFLFTWFYLILLYFTCSCHYISTLLIREERRTTYMEACWFNAA